jgi:hypothetical protein
MRYARAIEDLIGAPLPVVRDVHYHRWQPSTGLAFFIVYVKLGLSQEDFNALVQRAGMDGVRHGGDAADRHLPAAWSAAPQVHLDWWDPEPSTPADSAAKAFGTNGWIIAKYERGAAYMIVTDTGRLEDAR